MKYRQCVNFCMNIPRQHDAFPNASQGMLAVTQHSMDEQTDLPHQQHTTYRVHTMSNIEIITDQYTSQPFSITHGSDHN